AAVRLDDDVAIPEIALVDPRPDVVKATRRVVREVRPVWALGRGKLDSSKQRRIWLRAISSGVKPADVRQTLYWGIRASVVTIGQCVPADLCESARQGERPRRAPAESDHNSGMGGDLHRCGCGSRR